MRFGIYQLPEVTESSKTVDHHKGGAMILNDGACLTRLRYWRPFQSEIWPHCRRRCKRRQLRA